MVLPVAHWLLMSLRHRAAVLPSAANPLISTGGLAGEGKSEYFAIMGAHALAATAAQIVWRVDAGHAGETATGPLRDRLRAAGIGFPLVAKPDIGWCGFGVRRCDSPAALGDYLARYPRGERVVLQVYVADPGEAGAFYVREPGAARGRLIGLALRRFPQVTGDGARTVAQLIAADARLQRALRDPLHRVALDLQRIPAAGETVRLSTIGSSRVGGLYRDGGALITPALVDAIDAIARDMREFHFGRFDLRYADEAALRAGRVTVIEVNGAGSEAIEAWDPDTTPRAAMRRILAKQALLFRIAAANRRRGFAPASLAELARKYFRQQRLIPRYPPSN